MKCLFDSRKSTIFAVRFKFFKNKYLMLQKDQVSRFIRLHSAEDNQPAIINTSAFMYAMHDDESEGTKVTYHSVDDTDVIVVNESPEKISTLAGQSCIRVHLSDDNSVAVLNHNYILTVLTDGETTTIDLYGDELEVNETPEKIYNLIVEAQNGKPATRARRKQSSAAQKAEKQSTDKV